jgi:hypothetical protein
MFVPLRRDSFASCGEDGATVAIFVYVYILLLCPPGTVVTWRMQPLLGDAAVDDTDKHVIMRHIPHMCDVKDVW